jgi:transaldolase
VRESPLRRLQAFGQSPWLDFIQRGLLESRRLVQVIADGWGLKGVTSKVSPHFAHDARHATAEARHLWSAVDRPNAMIKVPATREGLAAMRQFLAGGINVNVTLLFSVSRYREVAGTHLAALEDALDARRPIERIASVASFFLSRTDTRWSTATSIAWPSVGRRQRLRSAAKLPSRARGSRIGLSKT